MDKGFADYLVSMEKHKAAHSQMLKADGREDEAKLVRVEMNIIGIFRTVYEALKQTDGKVPHDAFSQKMADITKNWKERLPVAKAHGDFQTVAAEERKLAMVDKLMAAYVDSHGGENHGGA